MSEEEGRTDQVVSKEFWDAHLARNKSIIVDLMMGQLKSTVTCLTCKRIATAFDPYLSVCLPIMKEETLELVFMPAESHAIDKDGDMEHQNMIILNLKKVTKAHKIGDAKKELIKMLDLQETVKPEDLVVANQIGGVCSDIYSDNTISLNIDQEKEYTTMYHMPGLSEDKDLHPFELIFYEHKRTKRSYTTERLEKSVPRFGAFKHSDTLLDVKRKVYQLIRGAFEDQLKSDEELHSKIEVRVKENLPHVKSGTYTKTKAKCEFCEEKHGYREEHCELKINEQDVNEDLDLAKKITVADLKNQMEHKRRLIFAIVIKNTRETVNIRELGTKYRKFSKRGAGADGKSLEEMAADVITLANCFEGYSAEETLSGDDQWYCNKCKEHRDINKKLELYSVPKILVLQLKRFQQRRGMSQRGGMFGHMYA